MLKYIGDFEKLKCYGFIDCGTKFVKWLAHDIYGILVDDEYETVENIEELILLGLKHSKFQYILLNADIIALEIEKSGDVTCWDRTTYYPTSNQTYAFNTLYDLIKDGLVVKEEK